MRLLLLLIFFTSTVRVGYAQAYQKYVTQADSLYQLRDYVTSVAVYKKAFETRSPESRDLYNAACSAAMAGEGPTAMEFLRHAIASGWTNIEHLKSDTDLISLHSSMEWRDLLIEFQQRIDLMESKYDKSLQRELLKIFDDDQHSRQTLEQIKADTPNRQFKSDSLRKLILVQDSINLLKVTKIIDHYGWVSPELVGQRANLTLFLVIQHADLQTQVKYLPVLKDAVKRGAAKPDQLAMLEDRIAVRQRGKQVYGSQISYDVKSDKFILLPIENPREVDARRASVGLGPLAEYVSKWNIQWDPNAPQK
jgi:hypothetical protein